MIGGNITAKIQSKSANGTNAIGEAVNVWSDVKSIVGWLGLQSGEQKRVSFNAKVEESSHVFLCGYDADVYALASQDARMIIKGFVYDVTLIDNPDEMDEQLEIFLKRVGAWNG